MASSSASTVKAYLDELPPDRRKTIAAVRAVVRKHLPAGLQETMGYGMICYSVPLKTYPDTYNGQPLCYAALASQKQYCSLYLMGVYGDPARRRALETAFRQAGLKLDAGKSCIRFQTPDDLPLDAIGALVGGISMKDFIAASDRAHAKKR
jgi:uncharacterized protein YdhG (YjbR/CyaY superfamily)